MMAPFYLTFFLLVFCGAVQSIKGNGFNVSCTTDYISSLNCSCSGLTASCEIQANCSDEMGSTYGSCVVIPKQHWCITQLDDFFIIANPDTICTLTGNHVSRQASGEESTPSVVRLDQMIKPQQPANLTLTGHHKEFNLSWEMVYKEYQNVDLFGYLMYRVRLRPKDVKKEGLRVYNVREDRRYQEIRCEQLFPGSVYLVDVQASVNPILKNLKRETEWSEWSESVECTCPDSHGGFTGPSDLLWCLLGLCVLVLLGLFQFFKMWSNKLNKKSCLFQYIPDPYNFFKPLYHTYQGDFKESPVMFRLNRTAVFGRRDVIQEAQRIQAQKWVGPVFTFSSFDVLEKSAPLQVLSEKQQTAVPLQRPLLHDPGSGGSSLGDWSLLSWINPDLSKRYFLEGSSLGLAHSGGHVSIDTVTVSRQESAMSGKTDRNADEIPEETNDLEMGMSNISKEHEFDDWQLQANNAENGEELSLDSFSSNENSDYGYPQICLDLDTIDSGFLESDCSSPVSTECEGGDGMDSCLLGGTAGSHSNYVKQWVAFMPSSEENSNSL